VRDLARTEFVDQAVNVLAVGLPGTGKSHIGAALGHCLVERGRSVRIHLRSIRSVNHTPRGSASYHT
jgi:DNA replication protein DnaC